MRKVALSVAFLSAASVFTACGDDYPSNLDANTVIIYVDAGGTQTGDGGGTGADAGCPSATFITPAPAAKLTAVDDKDNAETGKSECKVNGFQIDVKLAVGAVDGTAVTILANGTAVGTGAVSGGTVVIPGVTLASDGASALTAQIGSNPACSVANAVSVDCKGVACSITKPVISPTHPKLNDVPVAEGGDRVSSNGSDYQAAFEVATGGADNSVVQLQIRRADAPESIVTLNATALGGKANFPGVTMRPDGQFQVQAICKSGVVEGRSALGTYTIDTVKPDLTISSPTMGQFFGPADLTGGKFKVCASTSSADAVGLGMALPRMGKNLGAGIGMSLDFVSVSAAGGGGGSGCVDVTCNGGAPFDLNVSLFDDAGNKTTKVISGVRCASALPSVQIVTPTGDVAPYANQANRLLASSSGQPFKDLDPNANGAQADVVACSDKPGKGSLFVGLEGGKSQQVGSTIDAVAAVAADNCPMGLGYTLRWTKATLLDSSSIDGQLDKPTQLRVDLVDISTAVGSSPLVKVWVDPVPPFIDIFNPNPLCGRLEQSAVDVLLPITLRSSADAVTLTVNSSGTDVSYAPKSTAGLAVDFGNVTLKPGENAIRAEAIEPSGNRSLLVSPCVIKVGQLPVVTFVTPGVGINLCANGNQSPSCLPDADANTVGWQGSLALSVSIAGAPATSGTVSLKAGDANLGQVNIDGTGNAIFPNVTVPDAVQLSLVATTSDLTGTGTGSATRTLVVDTIRPNAAATLDAQVQSRRETSFRLAWTAPADGTANVAGYDIRVARSAIDAGSFATAEKVSFTGVPAVAGQADALIVGGRLIEKEYFFALKAVDAVGNASEIVASTSIAAHFNSKIVPAPSIALAAGQLSFTIDGATDFNGDGRSDILVGSLVGQHCFLYFGNADPSQLGTPSVTFQGPVSVAYGLSVSSIGDIDADGKGDIAISAPNFGNGVVFIYKGRSTWNATYDYSDTEDGKRPDYVIDLGSTYAGRAFGGNVARLGDFNGDGVDDIAISAAGFNGARGRVVVVYGESGFSTTSLKTATIEGPDEAGGTFGSKLLGLGRFYTGQAGNTLLVSAAGSGAGKGRVYAFGPLSPSSTPYAISSALSFKEGTSNYGSTLSATGGSNGVPGVIVGSQTGGYLDVWTGTPAGGPFVSSKRFVGATSLNFARIGFGSVVPGTSTTRSLIGDASWDLVAAGSTKLDASAASLSIVDGSKLSTLSASQDVTDLPVDAVSLPLPNGWLRSSSQQNGLLRDLDGDGFADLAIGETNGTAALGSRQGRFVVFW